MNNTDRFTGKARAYAQGRPDYPASVVGLLTQESRRENPRLADIGSGTVSYTHLTLPTKLEV